MLVIPHGLYAIVDTASLRDRDFAMAVDGLLAGGAVMLQYRDKSTDRERRDAEARLMIERCRAHDVPAIINDDIALAAASGADGVHLGDGDGDPLEARHHLGPKAIIGVSCYDELERARVAKSGGADYVAFGRVYPSATKPGGPRARLELLQRARRELDLPVCAIGGIRPEHIPELLTAEVDLIAVIGGLYGEPDTQACTRAYSRMLHE